MCSQFVELGSLFTVSIYHNSLSFKDQFSFLRSSTFQTYRALYFENWSIIKQVTGTFVIVWLEILYILCLFSKVLVKSLIIFQFSKFKVLVKATKRGLLCTLIIDML